MPNSTTEKTTELETTPEARTLPEQAASPSVSSQRQPTVRGDSVGRRAVLGLVLGQVGGIARHALRDGHQNAIQSSEGLKPVDEIPGGD